MDQESDETFFGLDGGGVIDFPAGILGMSHGELKTLDCQIRSLSQVFCGDRKKRNMRYEVEWLPRRCQNGKQIKSIQVASWHPTAILVMR